MTQQTEPIFEREEYQLRKFKNDPPAPGEEPEEIVRLVYERGVLVKREIIKQERSDGPN